VAVANMSVSRAPFALTNERAKKLKGTFTAVKTK